MLTITQMKQGLSVMRQDVLRWKKEFDDAFIQKFIAEFMKFYRVAKDTADLPGDDLYFSKKGKQIELWDAYCEVMNAHEYVWELVAVKRREEFQEDIVAVEEKPQCPKCQGEESPHSVEFIDDGRWKCHECGTSFTLDEEVSNDANEEQRDTDPEHAKSESPSSSFQVSVPERGQASLKLSRGGARPGAGRPRTGTPRKVSITLPDEEWERIDQLISSGQIKSLSDYFRNCHFAQWTDE